MRKAVVTGASSGIGRAIAEMLLSEGYEVYGLGRKFEGTVNFEALVCDITETGKLVDVIKKLNKNHDVALLVNCAGCAYYGLHEELNPKKIQEIVRTNLEAPMILTNLLLRDLKNNHGTIVNISSVTAENKNPHGCAYGATKAGVTSFSRSLFEEARKYGVRVVNIQPDMTDTALYRNADFECDENIMARLSVDDVADAVRHAVTAREGLVMTDITIRPQLHRIKKK